MKELVQGGIKDNTDMGIINKIKIQICKVWANMSFKQRHKVP